MFFYLLETVQNATQSWLSYVPLLAAVLAFIASVGAIYDNGRRQRLAESNKIAQQQLVARTKLFAQLVWIQEMTQGELDYLNDGDPKYIWVPLFSNVLPTPAAFEQIELLGAEEVKAMTSFFYSYQEHMGYIIAACETNAGEKHKLGIGIVGFDYRDERRLGYLKWSLEIIRDRAHDGVSAIKAAVSINYKPDSEIAVAVNASGARSTMFTDVRHPEPLSSSVIR